MKCNHKSQLVQKKTENIGKGQRTGKTKGIQIER